jgi:hypothetical protein
MVAGAYWVAEWLATVVNTVWAVTGIGFGGSGRLGELWIHVVGAAPRTLAAASATAVLWLALEPDAPRRWIWALAGLFATLGLVSRQFYPVAGLVPDPVSRAMDVAVYSVLPALGCAAAAWLLGRFASTVGRAPAVPDSLGMPTHGQSRALAVVTGILVLLAGVFVGIWITSSVQVQQMSGFMVAVLDGARRSQYVLAQYREATYDEAKPALEQFAAYLEGQKPLSGAWEPGEAPLSDEKGLAFDRMLTYGRLALRAERANRAEEARNYWQRSERHAQLLHWEQPTRERIRSTVVRADTEQPGALTASPR